MRNQMGGGVKTESKPILFFFGDWYRPSFLCVHRGSGERENSLLPTHETWAELLTPSEPVHAEDRFSLDCVDASMVFNRFLDGKTVFLICFS